MRIIATGNGPCFKKDNLCDAPANDERNDVVLGGIAYLHGPSVYISDITPPGALAYVNEVAAEG